MTDAQKKARMEVAFRTLAYLRSDKNPFPRKMLFTHEPNDSRQIQQVSQKAWQTHFLEELIRQGLVERVKISRMVYYRSISHARIEDILYDYKDRDGLLLARLLWPNDSSIPSAIDESAVDEEEEEASTEEEASEDEEPEPANTTEKKETSTVKDTSTSVKNAATTPFQLRSLVGNNYSKGTSNQEFQEDLTDIITVTRANLELSRKFAENLIYLRDLLADIVAANGDIQKKLVTQDDHIHGLKKRLEALETVTSEHRNTSAVHYKTVKDLMNETMEGLVRVDVSLKTLNNGTEELTSVAKQLVSIEGSMQDLTKGVNATLAASRAEKRLQVPLMVKQMESMHAEMGSLRDLAIEVLDGEDET